MELWISAKSAARGNKQRCRQHTEQKCTGDKKSNRQRHIISADEKVDANQEYHRSKNLEERYGLAPKDKCPYRGDVFVLCVTEFEFDNFEHIVIVVHDQRSASTATVSISIFP